MANVTLKRKTDAGWIEMYPETNLAQITDISEVGVNLAQLDTPAGLSFVQINDDASVTLINADALKTALNAVDAVHTHTDLADIEGLSTALADKADLVDGKLVSGQIPDYLFSGMRKMSTVINAATTLTALHDLLVGSTDGEKQGGYFVVGTESSITWDTTHVMIGGGDEGDSVSPVVLEAGDWLVYAGYRNSKHEWSVVNNTYRSADAVSNGVVRLSATSAVSRYDLNSTVSSARVVDESKLRQVMKDIHYGGSPVGVTGDLWFDGTF